MLSYSRRSQRQKCSLLQHARRSITPAQSSPATTCITARLVSASGGNQQRSKSCPIKQNSSPSDSARTRPAGTPRFSPVRLPPISNLSPTCAWPLTATNTHISCSFLLPSQSDLDKAHFSSSSRTVMGAAKIDGTAIAKRIRANLQAEIQEKKKINPRYIPSLKIIQGVLKDTRHKLCAAC